MNSLLALKVAARYQVAKDFASPEALKDYLHEHPGADKSKHHVVKHDEGEHHDKEPKKSWKDSIKSLSEKAQGFFKSAPKIAKQFVEDEDFRRKTLLDAHKRLTEAPEKVVKDLVETAKHEVKEFKEAGAGVKAVLKGEKMTDHQKKAFKTVAFHLALTAAATALTATGGPLAAAGMFGKSMAKHVAMKSVSRAIGHLHILEEMGHIGHGIHHGLEHIMDKLASEKDPETAMAEFVMAAVGKEIQELDAGSLEDILSGAADEK